MEKLVSNRFPFFIIFSYKLTLELRSGFIVIDILV